MLSKQATIIRIEMKEGERRVCVCGSRVPSKCPERREVEEGAGEKDTFDENEMKNGNTMLGRRARREIAMGA
jgi:hypothetical protein